MNDKQLTAIIRAARPRPSKSEARRMDSRFELLIKQDKPKDRFGWLSPDLRAALVPVAGAACLIIVAAGLFGGSLLGGGRSAGPGNPVGNVAVPKSDRATGLTVAPTVAPSSEDLGQEERRVRRSADLSVRVGDVFASNRQASNLVTQNGGVVLSSNLNQSASQGTSGQMRLLVPSAKATVVVNQLAGLGKVEARSQSAEDITDGYNQSLVDLEEVRAERASLLKELRGADSEQARSRAKAKLTANRARLRQASADLAQLRRQAEQATISLTLLSDQAARDQARADDNHLDLTEAVALTGRVLSTLAAYALFLLLVASPLLLGLGAWLLVRRLRRGY